jgi:hypothetical protein
VVALTATLGLLAAGAATAVALMPAPDAPVNGRTLFESVQDRSGSAGDLLGETGSCVRGRRAGTWRCDVTDREGSGGAGYRVRVTGDGPCWTGRLEQDYSSRACPAG